MRFTTGILLFTIVLSSPAYPAEQQAAAHKRGDSIEKILQTLREIDEGKPVQVKSAAALEVSSTYQGKLNFCGLCCAMMLMKYWNLEQEDMFHTVRKYLLATGEMSPEYEEGQSNYGTWKKNFPGVNLLGVGKMFLQEYGLRGGVVLESGEGRLCLFPEMAGGKVQTREEAVRRTSDAKTALKKLRYLVGAGVPVMVGFRKLGATVSHLVVVKSYSGKEFTWNDSSNGNAITADEDMLVTRWERDNFPWLIFLPRDLKTVEQEKKQGQAQAKESRKTAALEGDIPEPLLSLDEYAKIKNNTPKLVILWHEEKLHSLGSESGIAFMDRLQSASEEANAGIDFYRCHGTEPGIIRVSYYEDGKFAATELFPVVKILSEKQLAEKVDAFKEKHFPK
jgi:hypothetical protein